MRLSLFKEFSLSSQGPYSLGVNLYSSASLLCIYLDGPGPYSLCVS